MKKKRLLIGMVLSLMACLGIGIFCACGKTSDATSGKASPQREIYDAYVAYATAAGDDVLSYEEWLDSIRGKDGVDGKDGEDGSSGQDGKDGADGKSAYDIWKENGHSGTESDFLNWLKGEKGDTGAQGAQGPKGDDGTDGKDGKDGLSAYELFMKYYPFYQGTEKDWIEDFTTDGLKLFTITFKAAGEEDIVRYAFKEQAILDVPEVPEKIGNRAVWDVTDFSSITEDMTVNAVYETIGLAYTLINNQQEYRVSAGSMSKDTEELFIPAVHENKPVTVIAENAFRGDSSDYYQFKLAHLPESITEIRGYAFRDCSQLQNIRIPSKITTITAGTFSYCDKLTTADLSNVTMIETSAFDSCTSLNSVHMPNVTEFDDMTFYNCDSLTTLKMPQVTRIEQMAFLGCDALVSLEMPKVTKIERGAFASCTSLEHLEIPSGVTQIASDLFSGCTSLKYVILPSGITSIESGVFSDCTVFETIYFKGDKATWDGILIGENNDILRDAKVYYYADRMPEENEGDYWHYDLDEVTPVVWKKQST